MKLKPNEKIDVKTILKDLEYYRPKRRGWVWREKKDIKIGDYSYKECSDSLKNYIKDLNSLTDKDINFLITETKSNKKYIDSILKTIGR